MYKRFVSFAVKAFNRFAQLVQLDGIFLRHPFGRYPQAMAPTYQSLFERECDSKYPEIDHFESSSGYAIESGWLERLAMRTQVTVKTSSLNWQHGRLLYSIVRKFLGSQHTPLQPFVSFETGTARGFSALCVAKAILDAQKPGVVITVDPIPHDSPMFWNTASDSLEGPISRQELLRDWRQEMGPIVFLRGWSKNTLRSTGLSRIDFAFLDAQHLFSEVVREFRWVSERQEPGAIVMFDDVTPGKFDGVVEAVNLIKSEGQYEVEFVTSSRNRGYAIATRIKP